MATGGDDQRQLIERNFRAGKNCVFNINNASNFGISAGGKEKQGLLPVDAVLQKIEELRKTFVKPETMVQAVKILKRHNHVTLTGAPGEGKTSTALMICEEFHRQHYEIIFVDDLDDFDEKQCYAISSNTCIVLDDIFGTIGISTNLQKMDRTLNTLNEIIKRKLTRPREPNLDSLSLGTRPEEVPVKIKVVLTSKTYNLNEGRAHLSKYNVNLFREETIIDLSAESLSKDSKRQIIAKLQREYPHTDLSEDAIREITEFRNPVFGFPLTSKLYFSEPVFQKEGIKFFKEPLFYLRSTIDTLMRENSNRKRVLILLVLFGGKLDLMSFQRNPENAIPKVIEDALSQIAPSGASALASVYEDAVNFSGTYCVIQDNTLLFSHPTIYDAVTCSMVTRYPLLLLQHCTLKFIFERVRLNRQQGTNDIYVDQVTNFVYVTSKYHELLITRISEHMKEGYFRLTLAHPIFKDKHLFLRLLDRIMKHLQDIVLCQDRESGESFLYWCTFSHNEFIVQQTLKCIRYTKADVISSIKACVHNGNLQALKLLVDEMQVRDNIPLQALAKSCKLATRAALSGHADVFKYLNDNEVDLETVDDDGKTVLHVACEAGHRGIVDLISQSFKAKFMHMRDFDGRTPLMLCAEYGHIILFKALTEKGADLRTTDYNSDTCFHLASMRGHNSIVEFILMKEPNMLKLLGSNGRTPLMAAARYGRDDTFRILNSESDISQTDDSNDSILSLAALGGSPAIVNTMLAVQDIDINVCGEYSRRPVSAAAICGNKEVFDLLMSENADISRVDSLDNTSLHYSCYGKNIAICKSVMKVRSYPNPINEKNKLGRTPALIAAKEGAKNILDLLLKCGADLNITDNANNSCLHQACLQGDSQLVKSMLNLNIFNVNIKGRFGWTSIMVSARMGHEHVFNLLVHDSALNLTDDSDNDLLWLACCGGNASLVKDLLSRNIFDTNRRGENGYTPAMAAARKSQKETFDIVVKDTDLCLSDDYDNDILSLAASGGNPSIVRHLLSLEVFDINRRSEAGRTPVLAAARKGNLEVVQVLVEEGADLSLTDRYDNNCLCLASKSNCGEVLAYLMSLNKLDLNCPGELKRSPILIAANSGNVNAFNALLAKDVNVTVTDEHKCDCLAIAAKGGSASIVRRLLEMKLFNVNRQGYHGYTPIMHAIERGHLKVYELLISAGADVSVTDCNGNDCLYLATKGGNVDIMKHLVSTKKFDTNRSGKDNLTPVLSAARHGHQYVFDILVKEKADLSLLDKFGNNCLISSAAGGNVNIVKYLLSLKVFDINCRGSSDWTPLMACCGGGHRQVFDVLIAEGADPTLTDADGNECLILASRSNQSDLVRHMLSLKKFDINSRGKDGKTAIMHAVLRGHVRTFFTLKSEGADLTLCDASNVILSDFAVMGKKPAIVRQFLTDDVQRISEPIVTKSNPNKCAVS